MNLLKYQDSSNLNLVQEGWDSDPEPGMYSSGYRYSHGESKSWLLNSGDLNSYHLKANFYEVRISNG